MYKTSSTLRNPDRSMQQLWRYLSAERLLDILSTEELFFVHLPHLEDQYEGALTHRSREYLANWFQHNHRNTLSIAYAEVDQYQKQRENFFVNCWHMNEHESYLMWKAYAGKGFAIQTSFERLKAAFESESPIIKGGVVDYIDFSRELTPVGNVFNHVATKDLPYRDEREFRLVFWALDPHNANHPRSALGTRIPVNVKMLIQNIVKNPFHEPPDGLLEQSLEKHGLSIKSSVVLANEHA